MKQHPFRQKKSIGMFFKPPPMFRNDNINQSILNKTQTLEKRAEERMTQGYE